LWQVAEVAGRHGPLLARLPPEEHSPLPEMTPFDETIADYSGLHLTTGPHLMAYLRADLEGSGVLPLASLDACRDGEAVRTAGAVIVRQRPGTARGFVFFTLEDETGTVQAIVPPDLYRANRQLIVTSPLLIVDGTLQKRDGTLSVKARRFEGIHAVAPLESHDFY
jgi:error-prone DNA polymerase